MVQDAISIYMRAEEELLSSSSPCCCLTAPLLYCCLRSNISVIRLQLHRSELQV